MSEKRLTDREKRREKLREAAVAAEALNRESGVGGVVVRVVGGQLRVTNPHLTITEK